jgi:hypothetical protein
MTKIAWRDHLLLECGILGKDNALAEAAALWILQKNRLDEGSRREDAT